MMRSLLAATLLIAAIAYAQEGAVQAWGLNAYGQCTVPSPNAAYVEVSTGLNHSLGLKANGTIVAWGYNNLGQCNVPDSGPYTAVAAGSYHRWPAPSWRGDSTTTASVKYLLPIRISPSWREREALRISEKSHV